MREMFNLKIEPSYLEAVIYFFINKTAYSGMIRYNANGEFNVPPLTEELYAKYMIEEYDQSYAVNIRNRFKADAKHIIVTNY